MSYKDPEKQREYQRLWIKERRDNFFANKICVKCGSIDRMELDHIDQKLKTSHHIWSWSKERREAEIVKCQVLCYECHRRKSANESSIFNMKVKIRPSISQLLEDHKTLTYAEIGKKYGVGRTTINFWLGQRKKRNNLPL